MPKDPEGHAPRLTREQQLAALAELLLDIYEGTQTGNMPAETEPLGPYLRPSRKQRHPKARFVLYPVKVQRKAPKRSLGPKHLHKQAVRTIPAQ